MSMQHPSKRILIVDDEPDILEFLQVILEEEGYQVVTSQ
jgi:DNA-binding response OmpR family regulator